MLIYRYTKKGDVVYAFFQNWPDDNVIELGSVKPGPDTEITMLGVDGIHLKWHKKSDSVVNIQLPYLTVKQLPSLYAWTLKLQHLLNA